MHHVLARLATTAQQDRAHELLAANEQEAAELGAQVGDPDAIPDQHGNLLTERREWHVDEHMTFFRHPLLCQWSSRAAAPVPPAAGHASPAGSGHVL